MHLEVRDGAPEVAQRLPPRGAPHVRLASVVGVGRLQVEHGRRMGDHLLVTPGCIGLQAGCTGLQAWGPPVRAAWTLSAARRATQAQVDGSATCCH